ncbi:hypothetical protein EST38_g13228 [Candolleomyces aberdarensis]|uniref:Uncharacterized protein n=1 Tax=Candolleomyces aberdarensis TaxID=2316362 RepID=A0A4Q2D378_9AGAR|nr:hypothetical protein EST38_g13228 [Candolleomyces aberdarensis]
MNPYSCVSGKCPDNFSGPSQTSLRRHQLQCPAFQEFRQDGKALRKERAALSRAEKEARKRKRVKVAHNAGSSAPIGTSATGASHSRAFSDNSDAQIMFLDSMDVDHDNAAVESGFTLPAPPAGELYPGVPPSPVDKPGQPAGSEIGSGPSEPPIPPPLRIRIRRPTPREVQDDLPESIPALSDDDDEDLEDIGNNEQRPIGATHGLTGIRRVILTFRDKLTTVANSFGLFRQYLHRPTFDPDRFVSPDDLAKSVAQHVDLEDEPNPPEPEYLHKNPTFSLLSEWQVTGSSEKSNKEMDRLVSDVFADPNFNLEDARRFKAQRVASEIDKNEAGTSFFNQFTEVSVSIDVPSGNPDVPPRTFHIPGLHFRPLTSLIRAAFAHPLAAQFHFSPFKLFHQSTDGKTQRVFCEVYDSDVFIQENDEVKKAKNPPDDPNCRREKVVAAMMLWSDSTHLADFGTAKLWPIYMALGNLSKYFRALPDVGAFQHVAYIPSIPDSIKNELLSWHKEHSKSKSKSAQQDILTHCRRELMHAVWRMLLDDDFVHAYQYGIVIKCMDGVERRVFPRFFTYAADYPENYLWEKVASARRWVYEKGRGVKSVYVEDYLKETSLVPTVNAFVDRLGRDFDLTGMLAPDLMHELELGVWKALFTHLVRVLYAAATDGSLVRELDARFRWISTFGGDTIRNFSNNTSEMKKLAARDYEDILQGELAHKLVKRLYGTTNKRRIEKQIGTRVRRIERAKLAAQRREQRLRLVQMRQVVHSEGTTSATVTSGHREQSAEPDVEEDRDPRYYISPSRNNGFDLSQLLKENRGNPAYKNFMRKLQDHLLGRRINRGFDGDAHDDFTDEDRNSVRIYGNKIYEWKEEFENYAFGFLDPAQVLRGCHLIPAFHSGQTDKLLPYDCAVARQVKLDSAENSSTQDWTNYYVNIFVDRDMVMRHYGGGVGHQANTQVHAPLDDEPPADQDHQVDEEELDDIQSSVELDIQQIDRELMELDERGEDGEIDEEVGQAEGIAAMDESDGELDEESNDEEEGEFPDFD